SVVVDVRLIVTLTVSHGAAWRLQDDLLAAAQGVQLNVPALRERGADLPKLVQQLLATSYVGDPAPELSRALLLKLGTFPYPGNVRELRSVLGSALAAAGDGPVTARHVAAVPR